MGVMLCDPWFYVVRDAVEFPDGSRRTHARVINRTGNGSAVLPVLRGKIVLVRHFRHALRRSLLEIPRGGIEPGSSPKTRRIRRYERRSAHKSGVSRCLDFYTASQTSSIAVCISTLPSWKLWGTPQIGEGIASISQFTVTEFEDMMRRGEILDSFTVAAYARAKLYRLI